MICFLLKRDKTGAAAVIRAQRPPGYALQDWGGRISSSAESCGENSDLRSTCEADGGISEAASDPGRCITGVAVAQPQQTQSHPAGQQSRPSSSSCWPSSPGQHESTGASPTSQFSTAGPGAEPQSWSAAGTVGTTSPSATTSMSRRKRIVSTALITTRF
jgi:hypothetical protein